MEIRITSRQILGILYVLSWIIFVGVSIEAGAFIFNSLYWLVLNPGVARYFWEKIDLQALYRYDHGYFFVVTLLMSIVAVLRACIFYLIIKVLHDKKLDLAQPFNRQVGRFIFMVSYLALMIGFFSFLGENYSDWLAKQGVAMPTLESLRLAGADVWLFMGVTLFVIGHIFKRGEEIQAENDLTI